MLVQLIFYRPSNAETVRQQTSPKGQQAESSQALFIYKQQEQATELNEQV